MINGKTPEEVQMSLEDFLDMLSASVIDLHKNLHTAKQAAKAQAATIAELQTKLVKEVAPPPVP